MNDQSSSTKWFLVAALVGFSLVILYPPSEKLKGGIDLVGGTSLLYEIDTTGLSSEQQSGLAERVMGILKERVDPNGQLNLEWRPIGNTRLEIRMPRPPKEALVRRERYNKVIDAIADKNLTRFDVESALSAPGDDRAAKLSKLTRGITERTPLLEVLSTAYTAYSAAQVDAGSALGGEATTAYEAAMSELLATSLPINRFTDILALPEGVNRDQELNKLRTSYPSYDGVEKLLTDAVTAYDAWAANKADLEDPSDLKRRLRGAGVLEFRILADRDPNSPLNTLDPNPQLCQPISKYTEQLAKYGPRPKAGDRFRWFPVVDVVSFMHLRDLSDFETQKSNPSQPIVEEYVGRYYALMHNDPEYGLLQEKGRRSWSLVQAYPDVDYQTGRNVVAFALDARGGQFFGEMTGANIQRNMCIMLDNAAMSFANILSQINERGQISGNFTTEEVQNLVRILDAGSLPARLKETPLSENTVGPSLGLTNRTKGFNAALWGCVSVAVFVLFYYGIAAGGMANIALAMNLLFVLAIMAFTQATFTLPGIAGLILTVGMAIDANVLIFERIREERDRGIIFRKALNAGYDKAFSTIMDANLTTLITCVILGFVGSEEVKGFAIVLGIGISTSMFTALFVTRLAFNSLISWGVLKDLSMRRIIGQPSVDWIALRRMFWPISTVAVALGITLFLTVSISRTEATYDIEFLGGTSLQLDLKDGIEKTDEEMIESIVADGDGHSAVTWLTRAADQLASARAEEGEVPGQFTLTSESLTGDQLRALMHRIIEDSLQRGGTRVSGRSVVFDSKPGAMTLDRFRNAVREASMYARNAAQRLRGSRVQSVMALDRADAGGSSYEVTTIETNRELVQAAMLATFGKDLAVQRSITFTTRQDDEITGESFFVVGLDARYLSDVFGGDANFDVRRFRGGVAIEVALDRGEEPLAREEFEKRLREVGLQPEFEQFRTRDWGVFPLGASTAQAGGNEKFRRFAVFAIDESVLHDEDPVQWTEALARPQLAQVEAALGQEKSLSKVVQFEPQIAGQTKNKALFAIILALAAIVSYLWLRFGRKEYGLAAIVALVHDVAITLGLVGMSQFVYDTFLGRALGLDAFRVDLPMVAAILTVIGYSLNDTIVVFDRIRENKGRVDSINANVINLSINQTLSRTLLTSITTFLVVFILYVFGGQGVHGFAFALLIGVVVGTYSSIGVATPLLHQPRLLHHVIRVMVGMVVVGLVFLLVDHLTARLALSAVAIIACALSIVRNINGSRHTPVGRAVGA